MSDKKRSVRRSVGVQATRYSEVKEGYRVRDLGKAGF